MKRDLYADITATIVAELERGAAPWVKQFASLPGAGHPHNAATGRPYSGCNVLLLWIATSARGWKAPRFLTYLQAQELGGHVRKGETGTRVVFVKQLAIRDRSEPSESDAATRLVPMLKQYTVFNVDQCDELPAGIITPTIKAPRNPDARAPLVDEFLQATGADIREGHGEAVYSSKLDFIGLPAFAAYSGADHFYCDAFHELGHWTGHKARLDRDLKHRFGDRAYAAEELVAELCSAFLCAEFSIDGDLRHAGYLAHWIELLKADHRAIFTASSKAQAAADYLRGLALAAPAAEPIAELEAA